MLIGMVKKKKIYLSIIFIGRAILLEKEIGFLFAYTFGNISPNNKINRVMIPTSIIKFAQNGIEEKYISSPKDEKSNTIAIFIKLFETNNAANNLLGFLRKSYIIFKLLFLDEFAFLISVLESEKKATSDPEIKAEKIKSNTIKLILNTKVYVSIKNRIGIRFI